MNINELLEKYFAGETSSEEEAMLKKHSGDNPVSDGLKETAALFSFFEEESKALSVLQEIREQEKIAFRKRRRITNSITAIAASVVLAVASIQIHASTKANYVLVDSKKITNPEIVQQQIEDAFDKVKTDNNILEQQLQFMFE